MLQTLFVYLLQRYCAFEETYSSAGLGLFPLHKLATLKLHESKQAKALKSPLLANYTPALLLSVTACPLTNAYSSLPLLFGLPFSLLFCLADLSVL